MNEKNSVFARKGATLREVALRAGVDVSTVSRAMRHDPRISGATRRQVEAAAKALDYHPNPYVTAFAAQMRRHRISSPRATIAVLDVKPEPGLQQTWLRRYLEGVEAEAAAQGFSVDRFRIGDPGLETPTKVGRVLRARGIRGLVVLPVMVRTSLRGLPFETLAVATIDPSLRSPAMDRATPDYFQGMQLALDELRRLGRRRIGFCSNRPELVRIGRRWMGGYLAWQVEHPEMEQLAPYLAPNLRAYRTEALRAAQWRRMRDDFARWLDHERPDAIISNLAHFPSWLEELGRSSDDVVFASLGIEDGKGGPGIDQRSDVVGAAALNLVSARIYRNDYGLPATPTTVHVPPRWVDEKRESVPEFFD